MYLGFDASNENASATKFIGGDLGSFKPELSRSHSHASGPPEMSVTLGIVTRIGLCRTDWPSSSAMRSYRIRDLVYI